MIVSHKLKCIYIKLRKVSGTSFELALSKYCGPHDIIGPLEKEAEDLRKALKYYGFQNCKYISRTEQWNYWKRKALQILLKRKHANIADYLVHKSHAPAYSIKNSIEPKLWNNYIKIATIRCPYDTYISGYYFYKHQKNMPDVWNFENYVAHANPLYFFFHGIHINKKLALDFLIRYEHLDEDIKNLETKIDCPGLLDTFKNISLQSNIRSQENTLPCEVYAKHPNAKLIIDEKFYAQQDNYEFLRKYWPMYKANLEKNIEKYQNTCPKNSNLALENM